MNNQVLKKVMKCMYGRKRPLPLDPKVVVRTEYSDGHALCEVWFMTEGCSHDRDGGCTMCNYGKGYKVDDNTILAALEANFALLPDEAYDLVINPSGSFLDNMEVSPKLRNGIYSLLQRLNFKSLTMESRADVIDYASLCELRNAFPECELFIEMGVESLDPWLLRNSVNKGLELEQIESALSMVHSQNMKAIANIGLGLPFLSEQHNITSAYRSIVKALEIGFEQVVLFPYHIKPGTLLEVLHGNGMYECCSLWSLSEVLAQLTEAQAGNVNISWHRNYYTDSSKVITSPTTCPLCRDLVLNLFDEYKNKPDKKVIKQLESIGCGCRQAWIDRVSKEQDSIDFNKITEMYEFLAGQFDIDSDVLRTELSLMKAGVTDLC